MRVCLCQLKVLFFVSELPSSWSALWCWFCRGIWWGVPYPTLARRTATLPVSLGSHRSVSFWALILPYCSWCIHVLAPQLGNDLLWGRNGALMFPFVPQHLLQGLTLVSTVWAVAWMKSRRQGGRGGKREEGSERERTQVGSLTKPWDQVKLYVKLRDSRLLVLWYPRNLSVWNQGENVFSFFLFLFKFLFKF